MCFAAQQTGGGGADDRKTRITVCVQNHRSEAGYTPA
jgi:hypothetical protein